MLDRTLTIYRVQSQKGQAEWRLLSEEELLEDQGPGGAHKWGNKTLIKPGGKGAFQTLKEPYLPEPWTNSPYCCRADGTASASAPNAVTVPKNNYFVMGDNRNFSSDSRSFGWVPRKNILAKAFLRIWPLSHFGGLGSGPSLSPNAAPALALPVLAAVGRAGLRRRRRVA